MSGTSPRPARTGLDRFDFAVLVALGAVSMAFVIVALAYGGVWTGLEGFVTADQVQYLTWIRESAGHVLIGNAFDIAPETHVFLHPPLLLSGGLHLLGLPVALAHLVWKPVAVLVLLLGVRRWVRALLPGLWPARAALVLALFFVPPVVAVRNDLGSRATGATLDFIAGEVWPAGHLWGYPMTALALGLVPLCLLWSERALERPADHRIRALAVLAAVLITLVHPWQGLILAGVLAASGLWSLLGREADPRPLLTALGPPIAAALLPLAYFFVLSHSDPSWERAFALYRHEFPRWPVWLIALSVGPLVLPALLGYRRRPARLRERMLLVWPPVALAVYLFPLSSFPFHAFSGVCIPLAVLAVRGLTPYAAHRRPRTVALLSIAAIALLVVPGAVDRVRSARIAVAFDVLPYRITAGERDALRALDDDPRPGGVLSRAFLGELVPPLGGRQTWVGTISWTPDYRERTDRTDALFGGRLSPAAARAYAVRSGARFVLVACADPTRALTRDLKPLIVATHRYGCATVHELRRQTETSSGSVLAGDRWSADGSGQRPNAAWASAAR